MSTLPDVAITGAVIESQWGNDVRTAIMENPAYLAQAAGDLFVGNGPGVLRRLAVGDGAPYQVPMINADGDDLEWGYAGTMIENSRIAPASRALANNRIPVQGAYVSMAAGLAVFIPFYVHEPVEVDAVSVDMAALAGANSNDTYDLGIYAADANYEPGAAIWRLGATVWGSTGIKRSTFSPVALSPRTLYYAAYLADDLVSGGGATPTVFGLTSTLNGAPGDAIGMLTQSGLTALPATAGAQRYSAGGTAFVPLVVFERSA